MVATQGELLLVMEHVHGESPSRLLRACATVRTPPPLPILSAVMVGVLHGLHRTRSPEARIPRAPPIRKMSTARFERVVHVQVPATGSWAPTAPLASLGPTSGPMGTAETHTRPVPSPVTEGQNESTSAGSTGTCFHTPALYVSTVP